MTDGIQITIGASGITGALANNAGLSPAQAQSIPTEIWSQALQNVQQGVYSDSPGARTYYEGHDKVTGGKLDYNPASKDFDGWNFNKGDVVTINEEKLEEINQLLRENAGLPVNSDLGDAVVTAQKKPAKLELSTKDIASQPIIANNLPEFAEGRQITRMVDGKKQTIEIAKDKDGNKAHYLVNEDGTRGEKLITIAKFGKNVYQTESRYLAEHKTGQETPVDTAENTPPEEKMYRTKNGEV